VRRSALATRTTTLPSRRPPHRWFHCGGFHFFFPFLFVFPQICSWLLVCCCVLARSSSQHSFLVLVGGLGLFWWSVAVPPCWSDEMLLVVVVVRQQCCLGFICVFLCAQLHLRFPCTVFVAFLFVLVLLGQRCLLFVLLVGCVESYMLWCFPCCGGCVVGACTSPVAWLGLVLVVLCCWCRLCLCVVRVVLVLFFLFRATWW